MCWYFFFAPKVLNNVNNYKLTYMIKKKQLANL